MQIHVRMINDPLQPAPAGEFSASQSRNLSPKTSCKLIGVKGCNGPSVHSLARSRARHASIETCQSENKPGAPIVSLDIVNNNLLGVSGGGGG